MPSDKDFEQAEYLAGRLAKRDRHLRKKFGRAGTDCYRAYDRDIPEIPLAIDRYGGSLVVYLFERPYEKPDVEEAAWLSLMADVAATTLGVARQDIRLKTRRRLGTDEQYEAAGNGSGREGRALAPAAGKESAGAVTGRRAGLTGVPARAPFAVMENGLSFLVDLDTYIDTGLFMDHRPAREMVRRMASGGTVLNLFCYTGSFSVYALAGQAASVTGVDLSNTYLEWAADNVRLNAFDDGRYTGVRSDVSAFLQQARAGGRSFDLIILDPPTFSNSSMMQGYLDVNRQWASLVQACLRVLAPGGTRLFSSNSRSLKVDPLTVPEAVFSDITRQSIPEDYRGTPHRTWLVRHV